MNPASANAQPGALHWVPSHPQPGASPALGVSQGMGTGPAGGPGLVGPMAGQGYGELETSPAAARLEQGLTAPGADMRYWAVVSPWGLAGTARARGAPGGLSADFFVKFLFSETFLSSGHDDGLLLPLPQHSLTLLGCRNSLWITLVH